MSIFENYETKPMAGHKVPFVVMCYIYAMNVSFFLDTPCITNCENESDFPAFLILNFRSPK